MTTATIIPERLDEIANLPLLAGAHSDAEYGRKMCVMEAVAYVAGEPRTDHPQCACPVIAGLLRRWNDRLGTSDLANAERDRLLKPLVARLVGSRSTEEVESKRAAMLRTWTRSAPLADWIEAAGLQEHADAVRAEPENINVIRAARSAAYKKRTEAFDPMRKKVREAVMAELKKKHPAVAAAAVVAADAAAAVAADAAAAAAVAADAAADLSYSDAYWKIRSAVYDTLYATFREAIDADQRISTLRVKHEQGLLDTIDAMLNVTPESLAA
jgi:hypothetical protein